MLGESGRGIAADIGSSLCRSLSEADLRPSSPEPQQSLKSRSGGDDCEVYKEPPCAAGRREETESGDDNCTQYSIHPPVHFPYFLLLQGFSYRQVVQICPTSTTPPPLTCFSSLLFPPPSSNISPTVFFCGGDGWGIPDMEIFYSRRQCYTIRPPGSCLIMPKT